ncbi:hypothetical protein H112_02537 [Trichophyton rubrum D6]|uniref:Uncharacterized protein n=2 Tax=Trichophyton TaxID=5550 RepID=A0A022W8Z0_TRIRU|nr:hypothetical protein H100_02538 [Trichophyton rubrum MR850]EZF44127.1 hypothetical protein H102_02532 [Trichophyton rubrum CBS 100081]EZF54774.1 hypothetical protein H103_02545 [Trichophyton rubrum CBS 288.86]EZF65392.1 hypothetical protein H104_02523 [Trichophyton rubrum CBS 289.86]EZF76018.1 hypothetical protein H105_02551 [Trichophyton soudanense CBS 452.61]EZF86686.1 hypothetical protein H110_02542 [Trichophyton rubrum MR1448]EZF97478.1 hypothetical protein H113_02551 [Trichophyton rub
MDGSHLRLCWPLLRVDVLFTSEGDEWLMDERKKSFPLLFLFVFVFWDQLNMNYPLPCSQYSGSAFSVTLGHRLYNTPFTSAARRRDHI